MERLNIHNRLELRRARRRKRREERDKKDPVDINTEVGGIVLKADIQERNIKNPNITMICFVYNEIKYLPHVVGFWKNQEVNIYVIDNYSNDGTWEWLQENKIPSHRFDTKEMFHLDWLQEEVVKTLHELKPDWIIYGAADLYYGFDRPIKDVIKEAERGGCNQIRVPCWFAVNTGEDRGLPLIENYFWCKPFANIVLISKYSSDISFAGDRINIFQSKIMDVDGIILNYGSCKTPEEQDVKLVRRRRAWDAGLKRGYGHHYRSGKEIDWVYKKDGLIDIRKSDNLKYLRKILDLCNSKFIMS